MLNNFLFSIVILKFIIQNIAADDKITNLAESGASAICDWQKVRVGIKADETNTGKWKSLGYAIDSNHCGSLCMMNYPMFQPHPCGAYTFTYDLPWGGPQHNCYMYTSNVDSASFNSAGPFDLYKRICKDNLSSTSSTTSPIKSTPTTTLTTTTTTTTISSTTTTTTPTTTTSTSTTPSSTSASSSTSTTTSPITSTTVLSSPPTPTATSPPTTNLQSTTTTSTTTKSTSPTNSPSVSTEKTTTSECSLDEYRNVSLQLNRQYRQLIALGKVPNKVGFLPSAKNYYEINYDNKLENSAKTWADYCQYNYQSNVQPSDAPKCVSETIYRSSANSSCEAIQKSFNAWTILQNGADPDSNSGSNTVWSKIVNYKSLYVGCSSKLCADGIYLTVCHYDKLPGQPLYEKGPNCVVDADCTMILESKCKNGMCIAPPKPDKVINSQCLFNPSENDYPTTMTDYARDQVVKWHNYYRSLIIKGNEVAEGGRKAPKGKNMYKLKYNCAIEESAQNHANTCPYPNPSPQTSHPGWGEIVTTIRISSCTYESLGEYFRAVVGSWYDTYLKYAIGDLITNTIIFPHDNQAARYTQVVWGKTYEIGCGARICENFWQIVCRYNIAGNVNGTAVYDVATTSDGGCKTDADCTTQASDTCSVSDGLCNRA